MLRTAGPSYLRNVLSGLTIAIKRHVMNDFYYTFLRIADILKWEDILTESALQTPSITGKKPARNLKMRLD